MKKLLLVLLFTISSNAQITQPTPYMLCDYGIPNYESFDLTTKIPEILNGLNPAENSVVFYSSYQAALDGNNPISDPTTYVNVSPSIMTLGVRVTNNLGEHSYTTLQIGLLPIPNPSPAILYFCDPMELPFYNLDAAIPQIVNGDPNVMIRFYETQTDAEIGSNPALSGFYAPITGPQQILYVRVEYPQTGCYAITTLTLDSDCGEPCPAPTGLTATNITETSFNLNWTDTGGSMGNIFYRVCIIPAGVPPTVQNSVIVQAPMTSYVFTNLINNACYSVYVQRACSTSESSAWSEPFLICMTDCANTGNCSDVLILNAFVDSNNNGIKDTGEFDFNQGNFVYQINDSGNNLYGNSNNGSYYIFDNNPSNSYDVSFAVNSALTNYYVSNATYSNVTLADGSGTNYLYFPITINQSYVDAALYIYPQNAPRPGFTYNVGISYRNNSFAAISNGTVTFTKDPNVTIVSISQSGTTTTGTGFTYDFTNLAYNEIRNITVTLQVPTIPTVNLNDLLTNSASIQVDNDANTANNSASFTQIVVGSYDPNDKAEAHGGKIVFDDFTANDYLYYTIRFENTGTANAEFIRVEDVLHADLDENTFEMLTASHPVNTRREDNELTWHFFDINLPPSSININDGHGFVHFRIKPRAGYAIGDVIPNTASIFFDYNPPIVTNTFETEFVEFLGNPDFETTNIVLYPNPAQDFVTINNPNGIISAVNIYEISGKRIYTTTESTATEISINVANFAKGLYLVEFYSAGGQKLTKKLIVK